MKETEIPFGAKDSELKSWEYTIPEGMEAGIKDGKIVVRKKQQELTEFEQMLYSIFDAYNGLKIDIRAAVDVNAKTLLELAKKEICKGCTVGLDQYWKGWEERGKQEKPITYHYPIYQPFCFHGGICTNPMKDCINCYKIHNTDSISRTTTTATPEKD